MGKFCPSCEKVMVASVATGLIVFTCPACGESVNGDDSDRILISRDFGSQFNPFSRFILGAARDPAGNKIEKQCPECKNDYMVRILLGEEETPVLTCVCGYTIGVKSSLT